MTRDDIIRMAREAGSVIELVQEKDLRWLERFAALVAAHKTEVAIAEAYRCGYEAGVVEERESCAKMLEGASKTGKIISCKSAAEAIRNRGKHE